MIKQEYHEGDELYFIMSAGELKNLYFQGYIFIREDKALRSIFTGPWV